MTSPGSTRTVPESRYLENPTHSRVLKSNPALSRCPQKEAVLSRLEELVVMLSHPLSIMGIGIPELTCESVQSIQNHLKLPSAPFKLLYC